MLYAIMYYRYLKFSDERFATMEWLTDGQSRRMIFWSKDKADRKARELSKQGRHGMAVVIESDFESEPKVVSSWMRGKSIEQLALGEDD